MRRGIIVLLAVTALFLPSLQPRAPHALAQTADATGEATVIAAYNLLLDDFVHALQPKTVLRAAWDSARSAARGDNANLPDLPTGREEALAAFLPAFRSLVASSRIDAGTIGGAAANGMARSVGEGHTFYLTPAGYAQFIAAAGGGGPSVGLGISLRGVDPPYTQPPWLIASVVPNSPAERAGLRAGDTLQRIDGLDAGVNRTTLSSLLAGEARSSVRLTISRPDVGDLELTVVRGAFAAPILSSRILAGNVGVIRLTSFPSSVVKGPDGLRVDQELDAALTSFDRAGVGFWILDLRGNGGGSVTTTDHIVGRFLADGAIQQRHDDHGHFAAELPDGHLFPRQQPLAVLIDGGSASSSEVTATAVREYGRGILVGSRSRGSLAENETFPLPNGGGLAVTLAEVVTGHNGQIVNEVGVEPDISASRLPTAAELAAGTDPVVDDAVRALRGAKVPAQIPVASPGTLSETELRALLAGYGADAADVPPTPLSQAPKLIGDTAHTHRNEFASGARDPFALRGTVLSRGWQGQYEQDFGDVPGGPGLGVTIDLYADEAGARDAVLINDFPDQLVSVAAPATLGDETIAYRGQWDANGSLLLIWRHGRAVFSVSYFTQPGIESFDPVLTLAGAVEARYQAAPLAAVNTQPSAFSSRLATVGFPMADGY